MRVKFKKLTPTTKMPTRAHATDAGLDLYMDEVVASSGQIQYFSGVAIEMFPRSSVSKMDCRMSNCVGVIDHGYTGNISGVFDIDHSLTGKKYGIGDRFAQLIILPYPSIELVEAEKLTTSDRGEGGYGSTGK